MLDKGLTFIPTYKYLPLYDVYSLQNRLVRNLKLKDYFRDDDQDADKTFDFKTKTFESPSTWTPPDHKVSQQTLDTVQTIVDATESLIQRYRQQNDRFLVLRHLNDNLSIDERRALHELRNNDSIVIKPADKGSSTVVMDKSAYVTECYRQLNNTDYYRKLDRPIYGDNVSKINDILRDMADEGVISRKQLEYLRADDTDRQRVFYVLPKIHKPRSKWPQPDRMPEGRPIVSDCGSESYRVSQFIDSFIRPISSRHRSYLKDTYDFVSKVRHQRIPKNAFLVTGDVSALYTNMRFDRTLSTVRAALGKHPAAGRPDDHLLRLLELTMRNNDFEFNGDHYLQVCGMAMGKTYAPGLADIYMEEVDEKAMAYRIAPLFFYRFLDDVFFVWTGTLAELREYEVYLNSLVDGIKITLNWSTTSIDFLDTTVYKNTDDPDVDILQTRVFFKETDTHQLLHKSSFHPRHTTRGVLKSQLLRFKRISTTKVDYDETCGILFRALAKRSYSRSLMRKMKRDIWNDNADTDRTPPGDRLLPIVVPYNNVGIQLAQRWKEAISGNDVFDGTRLITAYTNGPNIRRKLVRGSLRPTPSTHPTPKISRQKTQGCNRCVNTRCKACNYIVPSCSFTSSHNFKNFSVRGSINCKTCNIVYLVTCRKCRQQYIGETSRPLADRINDHLSAIRLRKQTPIGLHFNDRGHSINHFSIIGIEQFNERDPPAMRRIKESVWQNLLQTAYPNGINNLKSSHITRNTF